MSARRRFPVTAYDQINLTNLIDMLFFLLIIFMITAPLLEYSVDVTPPEMNADPIIQHQPPEKQRERMHTASIKGAFSLGAHLSSFQLQAADC